MKKEKLFWGFFFIGASILLIMKQMDFLPDINVFTLLFTFILIYILIKSLIHRSIAGIVFPIAFLYIIYDELLGIAGISTWAILLAATLMTIGLHFLIPQKYSYYQNHNHKTSKEFVNSSQLEFNISFASSAKYVETEHFESLNLNCHFGACEIYFDHATIKNDSALLNLNIDFCGVALFIPRDWNIENHVDCMFAGIDDNANKPYVANGPTLIIQGKASFAGIEIHYI